VESPGGQVREGTATRAEIARDPALGQLYSMVYMLHIDLVEALKSRGIPSGKRLISSASTRQQWNGLHLKPIVIADQADRLRGESGPDHKTSLFNWACRDSTVFWVVAHAQCAAVSQDDALTVLHHYAGGDVPHILTHFADSDDCFRAAIEALVRFDNFDTNNPAQKSTAASFLCYFQNSPVFKAALAKHGAKLIPALSSGRDGKGGEAILTTIANNPNDIGQVCGNWTVRRSPATVWTWIPGGNIVYVGGRDCKGQISGTGRWIWAGVDVFVLVPLTEGIN